MVEVYPAASLKCWGLPYRGYKQPHNTQPLGVLMDDLLAAAPWLEPGRHERLCRDLTRRRRRGHRRANRPCGGAGPGDPAGSRAGNSAPHRRLDRPANLTTKRTHLKRSQRLDLTSRRSALVSEPFESIDIAR